MTSWIATEYKPTRPRIAPPWVEMILGFACIAFIVGVFELPKLWGMR